MPFTAISSLHHYSWCPPSIEPHRAPRSLHRPSRSNHRTAVQLLTLAAGATIKDPRPSTVTSDSTAAEGGSASSAVRSDVSFSEDGLVSAAWVLSQAYLQGEGVEQDTKVADVLLQHAAAGGDPNAQGEVGWRSALGLQPSATHLFQFGKPDIPKCVLSLTEYKAECDFISMSDLLYRICTLIVSTCRSMGHSMRPF